MHPLHPRRLAPLSAALSLLVVSAVLAGRARPAAALKCDGGDVSFELLTGYAASPAAKHAMREQLALFTLPQCIDACRSDDQCAAVTYETGACVSYAAVPQKNANSDFPLKRSHYPTHTATVARKICVRKPKSCNQRSWSFDTIHGELKVTSKQHFKAITRSGCMDKCLNEKSFQCRSVNFNKETGDCYLNDVDQFTVSGRPPISNRSADVVDYMESNCVVEQPKMCDFAEVGGKLLRTVDAIYENVATADRCKEICLSSKEFQCRSFDYNETGVNVCRVSHHSTSSLSQQQLDHRPYLTVAGATTYQMSSCFSVKIDCRGADMVASVHTNRLFDGKVYAKNRPNSCVNDVKSTLDFDLRLDYHSPNCDVRQDQPGKFFTEIIIQHHDQIVTGQDIGLSVRCSYDLQNRSVGQGIELAMAPAVESDDDVESDAADKNGGGVSGNGVEETAFVISPTVMMRITNRAGGDIHAAQVGDPLSLRFHILDDRSPYEIFVRELIALDGVDTSEILLIDADGCPTDPAIMGPISAVDTGGGGTVKILEAPFDAFKFPTSDIVQFKALVTPCLPKCEPINCNVVGHNGAVRRADSFGRRRRRRSVGGGNQTEEVVFQEIRIEDKFKFEAQRGDPGHEINFSGSSGTVTSTNAAGDHQNTYWNTYAFALVLVAFVVLQLFVIFVCWLCVTYRSRGNREDASIYESAISEYASTVRTPISWDNSYYK
ncbi:uncharacterized protein LOC132924638 [Rhopalosiphum padi]|uniref:uncharacterized protein LOC132924638 n=1 Tax=Rhopalosiphum padi TaxID=40932 RepID=UPI00298DBC90|nr:uncharacterized protein LOC132924638 [Rhopalosiphum padi]